MKTIKYKVKVHYNNDKVYYTEWHNEKDQLHRENGPALEYANGDKFYFQNGVMHRLDGPAADRGGQWDQYVIDGKEYTKAQFLGKTKKKNDSCDGKIVDIDGIKYKLNLVKES